MKDFCGRKMGDFVFYSTTNGFRIGEITSCGKSENTGKSIMFPNITEISEDDFANIVKPHRKTHE